MYLGIEENTGLIYEGSSDPEIPAIPTPAVLQAKLIESDADWSALPRGIAVDPMQWAFREDSFDPVTRIRRGRLYQPIGTQPTDQFVVLHPYDDPMRRQAHSNGRFVKRLNVYVTCSQLLNMPRRGEGHTLALGNNDAASAWLIVSTEMLANRAVMVTLKAQSAYGVLPPLDDAKVPAALRVAVKQSFERVLDSAFRESPSSVVEHCRDALQVFISRWLVTQGQDEAVKREELAPIAGLVEKSPYKLVCVANLARVVARLHGGRGKTNEREDKGARELTDEDAELAVQIVGFALRDLGWAR